MTAQERTPAAIALCLVLVVAALAVFVTHFEWPTSQMVRGGQLLSERDIWVYDVLPLIAAGYGFGLCAIAITRFMFPKSNIRAITFVMAACAAAASVPLLALSVAISGTPTTRDLGTCAMLFAVPLAVATWAVVASFQRGQESR